MTGYGEMDCGIAIPSAFKVLRIAASLLWTRFSAIETVSPSRTLSAKFYASGEGMSIEAEWSRSGGRLFPILEVLLDHLTLPITRWEEKSMRVRRVCP